MLNQILVKSRTKNSKSKPTVVIGRYKCYLCPKNFGIERSFETHDELREHHRDKHFIHIVKPLEQQLSTPKKPRIKTLSKDLHLKDFELWFKLFKSEYPHYDFIEIHQSSLSAFTPQYILFNNRTKVKEVFTLEQIKTKLGY